MFHKALNNTAKTYEQSSEAVDQPGLSTSVTDEQSHAAIDQIAFPNTVTEKKSLGTFIRRVIYMKVHFMF